MNFSSAWLKPAGLPAPKERHEAARNQEISEVRAGIDRERHAGRVDQRQRADEVGPPRRHVNGHVAAHRVADEVHRLADLRLDPPRELRRDLLERQRDRQIDRQHPMPCRECLDVMAPPVGRAAEAVDQPDRRSGAGAAARRYRPKRPCSTIRQRSWTTLIPASASCCAAASLRIPSWNQTYFGFLATMSSTCCGMSLGRRKTLTMSTGPLMSASLRTTFLPRISVTSG